MSISREQQVEGHSRSHQGTTSESDACLQPSFRLPTGHPCVLLEGTCQATAGSKLVLSRRYRLFLADPFAPANEAFLQEMPGGWDVLRLAGRPVFRRYLPAADMLQLYHGDQEPWIALSGGFLYYLPQLGSRAQRVWRLRRWGPKIGRGIYLTGLAILSRHEAIFGEYFDNPRRTAVHLYGTRDGGGSWQVMHRWPPGTIRHVHAIQRDPFTNSLWICVGDTDAESHIYQTFDHGQQLEVIGSGSQQWRTCSLLFSKDHILWASDTARKVESRGIYRLTRGARVPEQLVATCGPVELGVKVDDQLFAFLATRFGYAEEADDWVSLWMGDGDRLWRRVPIARRVTSGPANGRLLALPNGSGLALSLKGVGPLQQKTIVISRSVIDELLHHPARRFEA